MASYYVIGADGQMYGPADEATLAGWAQQGRLTAQSTLQDAATNQRIYASQVPAIASSFAPAPVAAPTPAYQQPMGYQQQQTAMPMAGAYGYQQPAYQQPVAYRQPAPQAPLGYATPYATGMATHQLESFNVVAAIALHYVTLGLFSIFFHASKHGRLPMLRQDDPSTGKAIGFLFIPFYNIYWIFFMNTRLCDRINEQRQMAGLPPTAPKGLAIAYCIFQIIPYIGLFVGYTIIAPIYWGMLQASVNELVARTRGPMA